MSDLSQVIRWNANFVRGLAESVLSRARAIRGSLTPAATVKSAGVNAAGAKSPGVKVSGRKKPSRGSKVSGRDTGAKSSVRKSTKPARRSKRSDA